MRNGSILRWSIAAVCLVVATAAVAAPSNHESPKARSEAADKKLGVATLSAVVASTGVRSRGDGAGQTKRLSPGVYEVSFQRHIRDCVYAVTVGSIAAGVPAFGVPVVAWRANKPDSLFVQIFDKNGAVVDNGFHVVVSCGY